MNSIITSFSKSTKAESVVGIALLVAVAFLVNTGLPASEFQNQLQPNQQQQQEQFAASSLSSPVAGSTGDIIIIIIIMIVIKRDLFQQNF